MTVTDTQKAPLCTDAQRSLLDCSGSAGNPRNWEAVLAFNRLLAELIFLLDKLYIPYIISIYR